MRAITESGLRVGADISVVGYDDTEDSSCYIPPLTTIKQDFRLLGQTSVDRLLQLSQGQAVKGNQLLPVSLVKRKTTLAPNTQTASPRALVGFINAAGTTGFPTGKRAVSATQLM